MYELCQHLLASGRRCTQPAVAPTPYCRHHGIVKRTVASSILPPKFHHLHRALPFLYPEDRASITANCFLVMRALDDRRISTQTANTMNRLLRTCQANLKPGPLHEPDDEKPVGAPFKRSLSGEKTPDPSIVRRIILTPAGEEIAPPLEVWEEGEEQHHGESCPCRRCAQQYRAAAPEPHHPDCRCGQCPAAPEDNNAGAPSFRVPCERVGECEQPIPTDVIPTEPPGGPLKPGVGLSGEQTPADENVGAPQPALRSPKGLEEMWDKPNGGPTESSGAPFKRSLSGEQDNPTSSEEEDDEPYTFYEGDPIPPDPYAAEESEEERKQDEERRKQILDKHKDRLDRVEKTYLYTPQLADRIRDEIQQIMELEMGPEAFSYQPIHPPAS